MKLSLIFFGTPQFALHPLEAIAKNISPPKLIVTAPPDPKKGPSPVHEWAIKHKIEAVMLTGPI